MFVDYSLIKRIKRKTPFFAFFKLSKNIQNYPKLNIILSYMGNFYQSLQSKETSCKDVSFMLMRIFISVHYLVDELLPQCLIVG